MNGESSMEACTPTYVNRQPVGISCQDSGNSNSGTVITQRGGDAWDVGGRFQSWGHTYIYGSFVWMYDKSNRYCKAVINQLEINNCLLKKKRHEQKHKLCNQHRNSIQKLYNLRKQQKIYMAFGLVMSSNTQQKKPTYPIRNIHYFKH